MSLAEPGRSAVVCVECQRGVLGDGTILPALRAEADRVLPALAALLHAARAAGVRVVHATFEGGYGVRDHPPTPLWRATAGRNADWRPGHPDTQVLPSLLAPTDLVLPRHQGLSPTWGTEVLPVLRGFSVDTIVLVGASLNVALPLAAGQAVHEGFRVVVPRDAVVGTPREYGDLVLKHTMALLADLTVVADLVASWQDGG